MFGVEYFKRGAARRDERDFYTKGWSRSDRGAARKRSGPAAAARRTSRMRRARRRSTASSRRRRATSSPTRSFYFNNDATSSLYTTADANGTYRYNGILDGRIRKVGPSNNLVENQIQTLASIPTDRYSLFGRADYDVRDNLSFFVQGNLTKTNVRARFRSSTRRSPAESVQVGISTGASVG